LAFSYWFDKPRFLTEGILVAMPITPSLGVPNWSVIYINTAQQSSFFWRHCRGKRRFLQGEFRTHILYFVLVLLYFIFACIILSKTHKNFASFIVVISLLLVHYVVP
jgi:tryptophan-rich sensory protein